MNDPKLIIQSHFSEFKKSEYDWEHEFLLEFWFAINSHIGTISLQTSYAHATKP